jgi:hypothetical protein
MRAVMDTRCDNARLSSFKEERMSYKSKRVRSRRRCRGDRERAENKSDSSSGESDEAFDLRMGV